MHKKMWLLALVVSLFSFNLLAMEVPDDSEYPIEYRIKPAKLKNNKLWEEEISDQGSTETCSSHAVAECLKYVHGCDSISPFYLHDLTHTHLGNKEKKEGHFVENVIKFARDHGVPEDPKGNTSNFNFAKGKTKYSFEKFINVYEEIEGKDHIDKIKKALRIYGHPVVIDVISNIGQRNLLVNHTYELPNELRIPVAGDPQKREAHAVVIYGYTDKDRFNENGVRLKKGFLFKNSWGLPFKDTGKGIMPYDYLSQYSNGSAFVVLGIKYIKRDYSPIYGSPLVELETTLLPILHGIKDLKIGVKYRIYCETHNKGRRYLEAFPRDNKVRPKKKKAYNQDQCWFLESVGINKYRIGCSTKNKGLRYLEAYPRFNEARPNSKSLSQQDQLWTLEHIRDNFFRIGCLTKNGGQRYLEAFPTDKVVRPIHNRGNDHQFSVDQKWKFELWEQ